MYVNAVMTHPITRFDTSYAESLLMHVKHVLVTNTYEELKVKY